MSETARPGAGLVTRPVDILRALERSRMAEPETIRANLHLRYSSALQDDDSFERQSTAIRRWIMEWNMRNKDNPVEVNRVVKEPEVSRVLGVSERDALKAHLQDLQEGRARWVLCEESSRIGVGRVFEEFNNLIERYGGRVFVTSRGIPRDRWEGRTRSLIDGLVSGLEIVNISRRTWETKAALTESEPTRWVTGGSPGLGFMVVCKCRVCGVYSRDLYCDEHSGQVPPGKVPKFRVPVDYFDIDPGLSPEEAARVSPNPARRLIRRLFEMATDPTCCWRDLANEIAAAGFYVERDGETLPYSKDAAREIVRNPYYAGLAVYNRTSQPVGGRKRYNPVDDWRCSALEVDFPPFVEPDVYLKTQIYLDRQHKPGRGHRGRPPKHPLDGLLVCGACGGNYHQHTGKGYAYFRCATHYTRRACSNSRMVRAELWLDILTDRAWARAGERAGRLLGAARALGRKSEKPVLNERAIRAEVTDLDGRIEVLLKTADLTNEGTWSAYEKMLERTSRLKAELAVVISKKPLRKPARPVETLAALKAAGREVQTRFLREVIESATVAAVGRRQSAFSDHDKINWRSTT